MIQDKDMNADFHNGPDLGLESCGGQPMNDNDIKLPPLPKGEGGGLVQAWSYDQVCSYAHAAVLADRKRHDRMPAHEWIRAALDLPENAPYRFDYYAQEIERLRNDRKCRGEPVAWVAADTFNSPHPACVSSLAYMSQLDREQGREYVPLYAAPVAEQTADDARDALLDQALRERDEYHDIADKLAQAIADHLLIEIGEHSSANCPWIRALEAIENAAQASGEAQDAEDAARWRYIRRKLCLTSNGDGTCAMQAINLPAAIQGWPEPGQVAEFCDAAIDAAMQRTSDGGAA